MSALGHKRTSRAVQPMSALPPKADMVRYDRDVRFVPKADICGAAKFRLFDHLVGAGEQSWWNVDAHFSRSLRIDDQFELGRLLNRQIRWFCAF